MSRAGEWVAPWRPGLAQARCRGKNCAPGKCGHKDIDRMAVHHQPPGTGRLVVAVTLVNGLCVQCARTPETADDYQLDLAFG